MISYAKDEHGKYVMKGEFVRYALSVAFSVITIHIDDEELIEEYANL